MWRAWLRRIVTLAVLLLGAFALAPAGRAAASAGPTCRPGGSAEGQFVLSVRGTGPYRIGASEQRLAGLGLIDYWGQPAPNTTGIFYAGATGGYAGAIILTFRNHRLVEISTATSSVVSPAGAMVGMSFAELERIYRHRGRLIHNSAGSPAYLVPHGRMVELFGAHPIRPGVGTFTVGPRDLTLHRFLTAGQ